MSNLMTPAADHAPLGALLDANRDAILGRWSSLRSDVKTSPHAAPGNEFHLEDKPDLLSILIHEFDENAAGRSQINPTLVSRVRDSNYRITDLYVEMSTLESAIREIMENADNLPSADVQKIVESSSDVLREAFSAVLHETSEIYEFATENDRQGFCQLDEDGAIRFANLEMHRLLSAKALIGKKLDTFFEGDEAAYVRSAIRGRVSGRRELHVESDTGRSTLFADIRKLRSNVYVTGAYASFTDVSSITEHHMTIFDESPLAIVRIDTEVHVTYANRAFLDLIGVSHWKNLKVTDFVTEPDSRKQLEQQLANRKEGKGSEYETTITPLEAGASPIPVSVTGSPVRDTRGDVIGSFAIMRDLRLRHATELIHQAIELSHTTAYQDLLTAVFDEIYKIVPFQLGVVSRLSKSRKHAASILNYFRGSEVSFDRRWYPLTPAMLELTRDPAADFVDDLEVFIRRPALEPFRDDPALLQMLDQDLKSFIRLRIESQDQLAIVSLFRTGTSAFDRNELEWLRSLPIREAVSAALHRQRREELQFRYHVIRSVLSSKSVAEIADLFVHEFGRFYKWDYTALFAANHVDRTFRISSQLSGSGDARLLSNDYSQSFTTGILGECLEKEEIVVNEDISTDPETAENYLKEIGPTQSVCCCPIRWDGQIRWLLLISDNIKAAFADEEIDAIKDLVSELESVLENLIARIRLVSAFEQTSDAVFFTNMNFRIKDVNDAGAKLLGYQKTSAITSQKKNLKRSFRETEQMTALLASSRPSMEVKLKRRGGHPEDDVSVLMSSFENPTEVPGRVFVAKDLTDFNRVKELEGLQELFYDLAIETQTPLALAVTWLRQLADNPETRTQTIRKVISVLGQLSRVNVTFDRLALAHEGRDNLVTDMLNLNLATELKRALDGFPEDDSNAVELSLAERLPYVKADPYQISFVFRTLLAYLLRGRPRGPTTHKPITVSVQETKDGVEAIFHGHVPPPNVTRSDNVLLAQVRAEMVLGESVIRDFIEHNQKGQYALTLSDSGVLDASITLPPAK